MKKNKKLLEEEISLELENLKMLVDVDQRKAAIDELTKLLDRAIQLQKLEDDSRDKKHLLNLEHELKLEEIKAETDSKLSILNEENNCKCELQQMDLKFKQEQDKKNDILKRDEFKLNFKIAAISAIVGIGGVLVSTSLTIWGTLKTLKFEETGTITTTAGKGHISKIFRK